MSVTLRFQSSGMVPGDGQPVVMRGVSLTIGRGPENDLVLPDPDRQISKTHCVIENQNGNLVVVDFSTNGTFLNYGKVPLGRTPTPLNDGDVLILGGYEIVVQTGARARATAGMDIPAPLPETRASFGNAAAAPDPLRLLDDAAPGGDFLDQLLGSAPPKGPAKTRIDDDFAELLPPLGEDPLSLAPLPEPAAPAMPDHGRAVSDAFRPAAPKAAVIPDDWEDLLAPVASPKTPLVPAAPPLAAPPPYVPPSQPLDPIADQTAPFARAPDPVAPQPSPFATELPQTARPMPSAPPPAEPSATRSAPAAPPTAPVSVPPSAGMPDPAARAFLQALGAEEVRIPDADLAETMGRMGRVLRAMVSGLREILMTRTAIKSEFRIDQTMVAVGGNNPLKFSVSPEQAIEAMVRPTARGYLPAEVATAQALDDIKAHEVAMVTGMEAALKGVLAKLDPATLTEKIEARGGISGFLKGRKAQYWETYEKMYADIADQAQNDFHELFAREFAAAYKAQLAKLKAAKE